MIPQNAGQCKTEPTPPTSTRPKSRQMSPRLTDTKARQKQYPKMKEKSFGIP
jgi:hypothetical protein